MHSLTTQRATLTRLWAAVALATTLLLFASAGVAFAANPGATGTSTGTATGTGTGSKPGTPSKTPTKPSTGSSGGGSGGTTYTAGQAVPFSASNTYWFPSQPPATLGVGASYLSGATASYNGKCSGSTQWGPYIGVRTSVSGVAAYSAGAGGIRLSSASYTCIDPPHFVDRATKCAWSVGGVFTGPQGNPTVANETKTYAPVLTQFATSGATSPALCAASYAATFAGDNDSFGRYSVEATGYQMACTLRTYTTANARTGVTPASTIVSCNGIYPLNNNVVKYQRYCGLKSPGYEMGWGGTHTFDRTECNSAQPGTPGQYICWAQPQQPTYDGVSAGKGQKAQILDDGKSRDLRWTSPTPTGQIRNVSGETRWLTGIDGTPMKSGSPDGSTQPFVFSPKYADQVRYNLGDSATWGLAFQDAGLPGDPFTVTPKWRFSADFPRIVTDVDGIDLATGAIIPGASRTVWERDVATCTGAPAEIDVFRARISN